MNKLEKKILELKNENVRLRSSVNELKILNEIALTTGRATDIDQILNLIVQKCISVIEAEQGSILLVTDDYKEPFKTIIRQDDSSSLKHTYHIGSNITGCVLLNKEPIIIEDLAKDKRFSPTEEEKKDIHSVLCVPIWYEGGITGLMMLVNKKNGKHFSSNDLTLFTIISVQAGQLIKNLQLQKENFQKIKETEKLHELDSLKTNFFTNISHEFRTPLTLILGPVEKILESTDNEIVKDNAKLIFRSAKRLNKLADQLLDLARIEAGMLKLKASRQNMIGLLKEIVDSFRMIAESKNINLILNAGYNEIIVFLDRDKFEKVISNIISNAFKFTPDKGCVKVEVRQKEIEIEISISDTGIGIPAEQLDKIFDRFYQAGNILHKEYQGSGVGLSLTKELVELHKGKINVESKEGKGTTFNVTFPLGMAHLKPDELCEEPSAEKQNDYGNIPFEVQEKQFNENESKKLTKLEIDLEEYEKLPIVLIIEDNEDVRNYIASIMKGYCKTLSAENGEEGLVKSFENIPDIIISDVMMPELDGFQLCRKIKTDFRTSHIPVILLTAKSTIKDKLEGFETGADAYIMKPFDASELRARVSNLLQQRKRMHEYFQNHGLFEIDEGNITSDERKFLTKAVEIINNHLVDPSFSVESFAESLAVSRSLLHKKLTALTGESPGELIKRYRLNKAAKLLEGKSGNITEIAFEVGFNDASYFTYCFRKQFGMLPSQYHKNNSCN